MYRVSFLLLCGIITIVPLPPFRFFFIFSSFFFSFFFLFFLYFSIFVIKQEEYVVMINVCVENVVSNTSAVEILSSHNRFEIERDWHRCLT